MQRLAILAAGLFVVVACSSSSSSTQKLSCKLNGVCYKCNTEQAEADCAKTGGSSCTKTDLSYCD